MIPSLITSHCRVNKILDHILINHTRARAHAHAHALALAYVLAHALAHVLALPFKSDINNF